MTSDTVKESPARQFLRETFEKVVLRMNGVSIPLLGRNIWIEEGPKRHFLGSELVFIRTEKHAWALCFSEKSAGRYAEERAADISAVLVLPKSQQKGKLVEARDTHGIFGTCYADVDSPIFDPQSILQLLMETFEGGEDLRNSILAGDNLGRIGTRDTSRFADFMHALGHKAFENHRYDSFSEYPEEMQELSIRNICRLLAGENISAQSWDVGGNLRIGLPKGV